LTQEFLKYVVVRYSVYQSPEFDEPMDGIIYMTAAGIGFATHENYQFLSGMRGEVFLSAGAARVVVTTLAHACFAGVLGYAVGRAKFWSGRNWLRTGVLAVGLLCAAVLNGTFAMGHDLIVVAGLEVTPWRAVAFAFGFAAIVFLVLSFMMQRLLDISPFKP
jgi:RsiW-degrading membrane proteinase PrsW (M82 family)